MQSTTTDVSDRTTTARVAPGADVPSGFAKALFGQSAAEDLAAYTPGGLAKLVHSAYAYLAAPRSVATAKIRIFDPDPADDPCLAEISIVEVVNDDMPFLLDSALAQLEEAGREVRLVAHPVIGVERDAGGALRHVDLGLTSGQRESLIHLHVDRIGDETQRADLLDTLERTYEAVRLSCDDWAPMQGRIKELIDAYRSYPPPIRSENAAETTAFLEWLLADDFTLLGVLEQNLAGDVAQPPAFERGRAWGIMRDPAVRVLRRGHELVDVTPEMAAFYADSQTLIVTKANVKSRVHRAAHLDYIGVKLFSPAGQLTGELRIVGLFTANVYTTPTSGIPYVRQKAASVLASAGLEPRSYSGKVLANVLETYPRDELFQIDVATLREFSAAIASLTDRPRLRVLARIDRFDRFASVLTFIPRDRYDTAVRVKVGEYLARQFDGRLVAHYPFYTASPLVRTHYIIGHYEGEMPRVAQLDLETGVAGIVRTWADSLKEALSDRFGATGAALAQRYATGFSAGYMEAFTANDALADIAILERLTDKTPHAVQLHRAENGPDTRANLKVFSRGRPMPLSERVPILERMGFRVVSERTFGAGAETWLHDMALERSDGGPIDLKERAVAVEGVLDTVLRGEAESDSLNGLALASGMAWRDIALLRTLSRYLQQTRIRFSQGYMATTLVRYASTADALVALVYARFDPALDVTLTQRAEREKAITAEIEAALASTTTLDEDRILRRFLNLVQAAVRTNYFQSTPQGRKREVISFKFESHKIDALPLPHPLYEIAMHSPRVEGVHLRFGRVARGGLRWSDRPQDFRTEILGLVKAQQVKNAVIVPVGAKGGFIAKQLPPASQRDAWMAEGIAAYKIFVGALLDLTDNYDGDLVLPPSDTVRHDGDDPYLVVAADKGTASFSDIANGVSVQHRHWLGDAFASGGSVGYDHKKMAITARGAWEAVKRHFREIDIDIQRTPFTVVGVGDMSGDVFGNGMLLSEQTRLVAAFDHRDIFIDPDPDPSAGYAERKRLYGLARSSWQDYDPARLSAGGGIYARNAREVPLSIQARKLLGIEGAHPSPQEVMSAILAAPVDLLWFGGIGTYVRATTETDDVVGDRANDTIRVAADQLRCKAIGEGANLGVTQRARVEAARRGVRLNTDAIDNSAGVNTSDLEVNIKIALAKPADDGRLDEAARSVLLADMTDAVGALALRNNYLQTLALSLAEKRGVQELGFQRRMMEELERAGRLNRGVEFLPDDAALTARARAGQALTRPELSVLTAYAKLALYDDILESKLPDDPYFDSELSAYFPPQLNERFPDAIKNHRLHREIVATALANGVVNRGGPTLVTRAGDDTGAGPVDLVRAFVWVRDVFDIESLNGEIDALDTKVSGQLQLSLYAQVQDLLRSRLVWFIRNVDASDGLGAAIERFRKGVADVGHALQQSSAPAVRDALAKRADELQAAGVSQAAVARLAALDQLQAAPDIVLVGEHSGRSIDVVAATFFAADDVFGFSGLFRAACEIAVGEYYDRLALDTAVGQIETARRRLTASIVAAAPEGGGADNAIKAWIDRRGPHAQALRGSVASLVDGGLTLSKLIVAASQLSDLAAGQSGATAANGPIPRRPAIA